MEIRLDYATFNFSTGAMSPELVGKTLLGDNSLMRWSSKGNSGENSLVVSPHGCSWLPNSGYSLRPHRLQVSGLGCHNFAYVLPNLISVCSANGGEVSFSRLDFAFDVLIKRSEWKEFVKHAFSSSIDSDRDRKKYTLAGSGEAMTVYIGARSSPKFFRIYNKTLEDPRYQFKDNGVAVDVPDDSCVVRYEVELKRKLFNRNGNKVVFDPSPLFFQYYNNDDSLCDMIHDLWMSFGDDVLLPEGFASEKLILQSKNKDFVSISPEFALEVTNDLVVHSPYSFDRVRNYVVRNFAQYIPFIVADKIDWQICLDSALSRIGFFPEIDLFVNASYAFENLDSCDSDADILPWSDEISDFFSQVNINLDERSAADDP